MSWNDIPTWMQGAVIGASAWVIYLIIRYFEYRYSRALIENLGSKVKPYLYFSLPSVHSLLLALILFAAIGALLGFLYQKIRTARSA